MARKKEEIGFAPAAGVQQTPAATPVAPTPQMQMPLSTPVFATPQQQPKQGVQPDEVAAQAPQQQVVAPQAQPQMPTGGPTPTELYQQDNAAMVAWQQQQAPTPQPQTAVPTPQQQQQAQQAMAQAAAEYEAAKKAAPGMTPEQRESENMRKMFGIVMPEETKIPEVNKNYWSKYGNFNWNSNGGDFWKNAQESGLSLRDAMRYYDAYQKDNGGEPLDMWEKYALLKKYDPFRSMKDQDEEEESLKRHQKWEKIGNALSHLANLYGTMRGAIPSQPLEDAAALTERQQKAVDRVKALRKAAGQDYIDALAAKRADEFKQQDLKHKADVLKEQQRGNDLRDAYNREALAQRGEIAKANQEIANLKIKLAEAEQERKKARDAVDAEHKKNQDKVASQRANNESAKTKVTVEKHNQQKNSDKIVTTKSNVTGTERQQVTQYVPKKEAKQAVKGANSNIGSLGIKGSAKRGK